MYNLFRKDDYLLEDLFAPFFEEESKAHSALMRTDIKENDNEYILNIDMPGISKENIKLSYENGYLNVWFEQKEKQDEKENHKVIRKERYYTSGSRSFYLGDINKDKIDASLNNGVLHITLLKEKEVKNNNYIEIK